MACTPCQQRAEARRQAMINAAAKQNPEAMEKFKATMNGYSDPATTRVLPRHEDVQPMTNSSPTAWNAGYQAFMSKQRYGSV